VVFLRPVGKRPGTRQVDDIAGISGQPSPHAIDGTKPLAPPKNRTK
jgi:hypothetical protein